MSDIKYEFTDSHTTHNTKCRIISVLWPILGKRTNNPELTLTGLNSLLGIWRTKAVSLQADELGNVEVDKLKRLQYMRNCPPTMAVVKTTPDVTCHYCRLNPICPWCYARRIGYIFDDFATLVPNRSKLSDSYVRLVELSHSIVNKREDFGNYPSTVFDGYKGRAIRALKAIKPIMGYYTTQIVPVLDNSEKLRFRTFCRGLLAVDENWQVPDKLAKKAFKINVSDIQSKGGLILPISRMFRYQKSLLLSDVDSTKFVLRIMKNIRTIEKIGKRYGDKFSPKRGNA